MKTLPARVTAILPALVLVTSAAPSAVARTALTGSFSSTFYPPRESQFAGPGPVTYTAAGVLVRNVSLPVNCRVTLQNPGQAPANVTATGDATVRVIKNPAASWMSLAPAPPDTRPATVKQFRSGSITHSRRCPGPESG